MMRLVTAASSTTVDLVRATLGQEVAWWLPLGAPVAGLLLALPFVGDRLAILVVFLVIAALRFVVRMLRVLSALARVTQPPEGMAIVNQKRLAWFRADAIMMVVCLALVFAGLGICVLCFALPFGWALARAWEDGRLGRFEQEKGWRLLRVDDSASWTLRYYALSQV